MRTLPQGQYIKHVQYGLGVVTQSDAERTSIDFPLHGPKKFATQLMTGRTHRRSPSAKTSARQAQASIYPASSCHDIGKWQLSEKVEQPTRLRILRGESTRGVNYL